MPTSQLQMSAVEKIYLEALLALVVDCRGRHFPLLLVERGETALVLIYPARVLAATSHSLPRHSFLLS